MLSLNEKLSEVQLLRLRATSHALPLFYLRTLIFDTYARKNYALEINPNAGFITSALSFQPPPPPGFPKRMAFVPHTLLVSFRDRVARITARMVFKELNDMLPRYIAKTF